MKILVNESVLRLKLKEKFNSPATVDFKFNFSR
jgi:hypothetical protein